MAKKVAKLGLLTALSLIMFLVESLLPPMIVPGAKLGLGNIFIMLTLIYFSLPEAFLIVIAKSLLGGIFAGNFSSLIYSFSAGATSLLVTYMLIKLFSNHLSLVAIASFSATIHNLVQMLVFAVVTKSLNVLVYAPYLTILGMISGICTGSIVFVILKRKFDFFESINKNYRQ